MGRMASALTGMLFVMVCIVLLCLFWTQGDNYFKDYLQERGDHHVYNITD